MDKFTKKIELLISYNYLPKTIVEGKIYLFIYTYLFLASIATSLIFIMAIFLDSEFKNIAFTFMIIVFLSGVIPFLVMVSIDDHLFRVFDRIGPFFIPILNKKIKYMKSFKSSKKMHRYMKSFEILKINDIELNKENIKSFEKSLDIYLDELNNEKLKTDEQSRKKLDLEKQKRTEEFKKANFIN